MRNLLARLVASAILLCGAAVVPAQEFPSRPIQVVVPYATGGADSYIRPLQPKLEKAHGINLVIESVVGAGGTIGAAKVKRAPADGYTLLFCGSGALTIASKLSGAGLTLADFAPVANMVSIPYIIAVRKDSALRTNAEFLDYVKRNPGKLSYGSPGIGSAPHLAMEALLANLGGTATHAPFSGIVTALQSLLGGHIDAVVGAPSNVLAQVRAGQLIALSVTSRERFPLAPQIPALSESGLDVDVSSNFGFLAPRGTPKAVIDKLVAAFSDAAREPAYIAAMEGMQTRVQVLPPEAYLKALTAESASVDPIIARMAKK